MQLENGLYADVYAPEIIILIAFRLNTYNTYLFQMCIRDRPHPDYWQLASTLTTSFQKK